MTTSPPVSPLAPERPAELRPVPGVRIATGATGTRYKGRDDLTLMVFDEGTTVAGLLTRSRTPGHPVAWCRERLPRGAGRALVVNAGNANVFNGEAGDAAVRAVAEAAAAAVGGSAEEVLLASTGIIGLGLDPLPIASLLPELAADAAPGRWAEAALAIRTTDTFAKGACRTTVIDDLPVTLTGIAKGSGMIQPDMATMLAFVATDAPIAAPVLRALLEEANARSFACITVDGDTSTSDTLLLFATGKAWCSAILDPADRRLDVFRTVLTELLQDLAVQVVRDGEGATKLVTVDVTGASDDVSARRVGLTIANSPLVKTAIAGQDANWGRVVMAVGRSGEPVEPTRLGVAFGGIEVAKEGAVVPDWDEAAVTAHLEGPEVSIGVDLGVGEGSARVWTCDLTHGYIDINADYRS